MGYSIVRWQPYPDVWDRVDSSTEEPKNPKKSISAYSIAIWDSTADTWDHTYEASSSTISNVDITKTNIFKSEDGNIYLSFDISAIEDITYIEIIVNEFIYTDSGELPSTFNISIPKNAFETGDNILSISVFVDVDDDAYETFEYNIIVEDRDTTIAIRKYDFSSHFTYDSDKTNILLNTGASLNDGFIGEDVIITNDNSNINTYGRRTIVGITIDGTENDGKLRYLVSKDNRQTWWKLSYVLDEENEQIPQWQQVSIENICRDGMAKSKIESITKQEWKLWTGVAMNFNIDFAVGMESANSENGLQPIIKEFDITFTENDAPLIQNPKLVVGIYELEDGETIHAEVVNLIATLFDQEGDLVRYKVLVNSEQVYPEDEGWSIFLENGHEITKSFQYPMLNIVNHNPDEETEYLNNEIKLIVQDDRGKERVWLGNIIVVNDPPEIVVSYTNFSFSATISDPDKDKIAYRVLINDEQVFPTDGNNIISEKLYTDFEVQPLDIYYSWSSEDLIFNKPNLIAIEIIDEFELSNQVEFDVMGTYKGLMFIDSDGNYYTTDTGEILQYLDFGEVTAGTTTEPKIVYLRNQYGFDVEDILININEKLLPEGVDVRLSKLLSPFEDEITIIYSNILQDNEDISFYVRLITNAFAQDDGIFEIRTKADPST